MEDLREVIGVNRVLELKFSSREGQIETELWEATLKELDWSGDDYEPETEIVVATATRARVKLAGP